MYAINEVTETVTIKDNDDVIHKDIEVLLELDHEGKIERIYLLATFDKEQFRGHMEDIFAALDEMHYKLSDNYKAI